MLVGPGWFADAVGPVLREFVCLGLLFGKTVAVCWRLWILCPGRAYLALILRSWLHAESLAAELLPSPLCGAVTSKAVLCLGEKDVGVKTGV